MVSELLRERGWRVLHLGAGATAEQMPSFLAAQRPRALLVSATTPWGLAGAAQMVEMAQRVGVPVLVGGAAFGADESRALQIGAAGWARSAADAVALLDAWTVHPPALTAHRLPPEYLQFELSLPEIRRAAIEAAGEGRGPNDPASAAAAVDRLEMVLRHLGAALLVSDGRLFLDFLSLSRAYFEARQIGLGFLDTALQAAAGALPVELAGARALVRAGRTFLSGTDRVSSDVISGWSLPSPEHAAFEGSPAYPVAPADQAGRVFTDLLFVAAKSCQVPLALISLAQPDGRWSTLRHTPVGGPVGRRDRAGEELLFGLVASQAEPTEISNLAGHRQLAATAMAPLHLAVATSQIVVGVTAVRRRRHTPARSGRALDSGRNRRPRTRLIARHAVR